MKANAKALKWSSKFCAVTVSLMILFVFLEIFCSNRIFELFKNIFIGLFCSTVATFFITIPSYLVAKKHTLLVFIIEVEKLLIAIDGFDYLFIKYSSENIINYIFELQKEKIRNIKGINGRVDKYRDLLVKEFVSKYTYKSNITEKEYEIISDKIDKYVEQIRGEAKTIIKKYVDYSNKNIDSLNIAFNDIEFFYKNKTNKKKFIDIYNDLIKIMNVIRESSYHFKSFLENSGNESHSIKELLNLQTKLFEVVVKEDEKNIVYTVNESFLIRMLLILDDIKSILYSKKDIVKKQCLYDYNDSIIISKNHQIICFK